MLEALRQIALAFLAEELKAPADTDLEPWYRDLQQNHPERLFQFLVEPSERIPEVAVISADEADDTLAILNLREMTPELAPALPFMRPSGSQSPQIGPVLKRSYSNKKSGPSAKILNSTLEAWKNHTVSEKPWATYFAEVCAILERPRLKLPDQRICTWKLDGLSTCLEAAVEGLGAKPGTIFLTVADFKGNLPGQRKDYLQFLMLEKLAGDRYVTGTAPAHEHARCPLCNADKVTVFPNALKGAGINLANVDRDGAFPGINPTNAWKGYSLCRDCADLLFVYKFHCLNSRVEGQKRPFTCAIAGETALVVPFLHATSSEWRPMIRTVKDFVGHAHTDVEIDEDDLLDRLQENQAILSLDFVWAEIGQVIEDLRGAITDIPPTRLRALSEFNAIQPIHSVFPEHFLQEFRPSLGLNGLKALFRLPGGKKTQKLNEGRRSFQLRREVASCVYHGRLLPWSSMANELLAVSRCYLDESISDGDPYKLLNEGVNKKREPYLTACGWVKHLAWWLFYFKRLGVLPMPSDHYTPRLETLKPFFGPESGIDSTEKAFAFLLGLIYGRLLKIQGARGVNVGANALTWLKRLTLKGRDLPGLYVKIREKLLVYEAESSEDIRTIIEELGLLGTKLGTSVFLDEVSTNYFLLLGQSLSSKVLSKRTVESSKPEK